MCISVFKIEVAGNRSRKAISLHIKTQPLSVRKGKSFSDHYWN